MKAFLDSFWICCALRIHVVQDIHVEWIHVVQFRKRGRGNLSSRTILRLDCSPLDSRPSLNSSVEFKNLSFCFFLNFWNFFILYHFYVVLRGNLGVFVSWRFSCTCKQLLQGGLCTKHDVVHHTSSSSASSPSLSSFS